jgi:hypothetical protein
MTGNVSTSLANQTNYFLSMQYPICAVCNSVATYSPLFFSYREMSLYWSKFQVNVCGFLPNPSFMCVCVCVCLYTHTRVRSINWHKNRIDRHGTWYFSFFPVHVIILYRKTADKLLRFTHHPPPCSVFCCFGRVGLCTTQLPSPVELARCTTELLRQYIFMQKCHKLIYSVTYGPFPCISFPILTL